VEHGAVAALNAYLRPLPAALVEVLNAVAVTVSRGVAVEDRVRFGLRLVLCREPESSEVQQALTFMQELQQHEGVSPEVALDRFALLALNLNEFIFLD